MTPYRIQKAQGNEVPVVISVPHCGTAFPADISNQYKTEHLNDLDDTDWFVDKLYDFAPAFGITVIHAVYSRWVIDLNRNPQSEPLYTDGRIITGLCPTTNFQGEPLYVDERQQLSVSETTRRLQAYYDPYHAALQDLLKHTKQKFGKVLLWDCHSIRQRVPRINPDPFPDLILGSADEGSASPQVINTAYKTLASGPYSSAHNFLFKGGYITRQYGRPGEGQHALQLEMTKINYMDDAQRTYDAVRAEKMRELLKRTFENLIAALNV